MRQLIATAIALLSIAIVGCSKESDNYIVGEFTDGVYESYEWRGVYDYYDYNDQDEYVAFARVVIFTFEADFDATKKTMYFEGSNYLEDLTTTQTGRYARSSTKITLVYDGCGCSDTEECNCDYCDELESVEVYEYVYFDTYVDEEPEDEDDEEEYETYGTLELRLIDDDDPYTEWVTFRY